MYFARAFKSCRMRWAGHAARKATQDIHAIFQPESREGKRYCAVLRDRPAFGSKIGWICRTMRGLMDSAGSWWDAGAGCYKHSNVSVAFVKSGTV